MTELQLADFINNLTIPIVSAWSFYLVLKVSKKLGGML